MLLNLVDKHWKGEQSLHHNNNFLCKTVFGFGAMLKSEGNLKIIKELSSFHLWAPAQAVHILSMMEVDISGWEAEVRTLRREADALSFHAAAREEEHLTVTSLLSWRRLTAQLWVDSAPKKNLEFYTVFMSTTVILILT